MVTIMNPLARISQKPLKPNLNRLLSRTLIVAALSATGLASGWVPQFSGKSPSLVFPAPLRKSTVSNLWT